MGIALYDASVALFAQGLGGMQHFLKRGLAHCQDNNIDPAEIVDTRLFPDMLPFRYQVQAAIGHSVGAVTGCMGGVFKPPYGTAGADYAALQAEVAAALEALKHMSPADVNALEGKDVVFNLGETAMPFVAQDFILTFSIPNFHFHCTTAYDILRSKGVPLGKRDYVGRPKIKA